MSDDTIDLLHNRSKRVIERNMARIMIYCPTLIVLLIIFLPLFVLYANTMPELKLQQIYIPTLDKSLNSSTENNNTLTFHIRFKNVDDNKGINYGPVSVTFFDSPNKTHSIADFTIPKFYEGLKKSKTRGGTVNMTEFDREEAMEAIRARGSWVLRVEVTSSLWFNCLGMKSKKHSMKLGADVPVCETGTMLHPKKGIDLVKPNAPKSCTGFICALLVIVLSIPVLFVSFLLYGFLLAFIFGLMVFFAFCCSRLMSSNETSSFVV